jgi:hypothetical protein
MEIEISFVPMSKNWKGLSIWNFCRRRLSMLQDPRQGALRA